MPSERIKGRMWSPELRCIAAGTVATVYRNNFWWRKGDQTPLQVEFENPILAEVKDGRMVYFNVANTDAPVFTSPATISFPEESTFTHQFAANRTGVYSISGGDAALFTVARNTGLLTAVSGVLDYDQDRSPTYTMTVTFTPYDYRQSAITQAFTINVTDIDDGFTDLFTGTTGAFLDQRPGWSLAGGASGSLIISSNTVTPDTSKGAGAVFAPQIGDSAEQEIRYTLSSNASGPTGCLKLIDDQNYIGMRTGSSTLRLMAVVAGATTFQTVLPTNFNPNSGSLLILQQIGNTLRVYQSDALIYTVDMATLTQAQIPDALRNCKRSGILSTNQGGGIRNGVMTTKGITSGSDLPVGIDISGTVHDVLIEDVTATGHRMVYVPKKYTNGDGFSQEAQVYRVTYRRDVSTDNSDGGFDLKGQARLEDLVAERNGRNYRFWNDITASTLISNNPSGAHVWLNAKAAQSVTIDRLMVSSTTTAPVLRIENTYPVSIVVKECVIAVPAGTLLQWGGKAARVTWGKNCARDAKGYAVNTPVTVAAPRGFNAGQALDDRDGDGQVKLGTAWAKKLSVPTGTTVRSTGGTWYEIPK